MKILIVDDDAASRIGLESVLRDNYVIKSASSGKEALETAGQFKPDLILLDVVMPGLNGHEVCRQIRSDESLNGRTTIRHDSPPAPLGAESLLDRTPVLHRSEPQREGAFPSLQRYSTECVVSVITKTQHVLSILNNFDLF